MKNYQRTCSTFRHLSALALAASLSLPLVSLAASVSLATKPLAASTTSTVLPNLMFMLDDSGSMDWDYMPDDAKNFAGRYGYNNSHCNGVYYNPNITYTPPVNSSGVSYANASFTGAWKDGYQTGLGTVDLSTSFKGGSGSGSSGASGYTGPAFYYTYTGTQISSAQMDYHNTNSTFYKECNSAIGSTPGSPVFNKVRLATTPTTTMTVVSGGSGNPGTITVSGSSNGNVSNIKVNGLEILNATTSASRRSKTVATNIMNGINKCTSVAIGNCTTTGFSATISPTNTSQVIIASPPSAGGYSPVVTEGSSTGMSYAVTAFPTVTSTRVTSIRVNGIELLTSGPTAFFTSRYTLATGVAAGINAAGYSATSSNEIITVTGPTSASTYTPVITTDPASGGFSLTTDAFPESTPAKLQNFANWYSYYSNRMLMMKTGVGQAFSPIGDKFRVGFMTMNNNVNPDIVDIAPFNAAQKSAWYSKLYGANPGNSTPLREVLAKVGRLYAHKYGSITTYTSTITVNTGTGGSTSVDSITVGGVELLADASIGSTNTYTVAKNIAGQFIDPSSYNALATNNKVVITGPSSAEGSTPVISDDGGGMTFTVTPFTASTLTANLNGITPADPVEYSCQQNFIILSTDGYWNGNAGYQVDGSTPVGNQDGQVARPQYDGATGATTVTTTYTDTWESASGNSCSGSKKRLKSQLRTFSCSVTTISGTAGAETCTSKVDTGSPTYASTSTCTSSTVPLQDPNPSTRVQSGTPVTTSTVVGGTSDTLADVAMYYYQSDLRTPELFNCTGATGIDVCLNNVFKTDTDNNGAQHMATFTLGLGASGRMAYSASYPTDSSGDYYSVWQGSTAHPAATPPVCAWQADGTTCNWPVPGSGQLENIDDLWHAAVDGRGTYFSATDPASLSSGMSSALAAIASRKGSAAAAATSTLNPVAGNNYAYVASYTTVKWQGNLEARTINVTNGVISDSASWCVESIVAGTCPAPATVVADNSGSSTVYNCVTAGATSTTCKAPGLFNDATDECRVQMATSCTGTMPAKIGPNKTDSAHPCYLNVDCDTRSIKTPNSAGTALINFDAAYATANPTNFSAAHISGLSQWPSIVAAGREADAAGVNLVNFLRGRTDHEDRATNLGALDNRLYRYREATMGDALESQPIYIGKPVFSYSDPGYSDYVTAQAGRLGTVYMGANDGMLHAFSALTAGGVAGGTERWAYVPSMVIPEMWKLADKDYANRHANFVNGSPIVSDVCPKDPPATCSGSEWKTILVGGLNAGGRGYYALDVTDPTAPALLWEFTTADDSDIGYSYGNPVITAKSDGTWVVLLTSGYNNTTGANPGKGYLYVLNAGTGLVISKIGTGVGDATTPSGLAKISAWNDTPASNRATFVYGGDLLGNVWRFDINTAGAPVQFATLLDPSGNPQPITTPPVLGKIGGKRIIFIGTGKYLETSDLSDTQQQSLYALKDDNSTYSNPAGSPRNSTTLVQQTLTEGGGDRTASNNPVDFSTGHGWYVDFPDSGERSNIESRLVQGTLLVATIVPSNSACSPGGYGWLNFFDYQSGSGIDSSGIVSVRYDNSIVGINVLYIDGQPVIETVTSNNPTPTINNDVLIKGTASGFTGKRVLWRELNP